MKDKDRPPLGERWAHLRFSVVGPLLAAPPRRRELRRALVELSVRKWIHPGTGQPTRFGLSTIERWYYAARRERLDPVGALRQAARKDSGEHRVVSARPSVFGPAVRNVLSTGK